MSGTSDVGIELAVAAFVLPAVAVGLAAAAVGSAAKAAASTAEAIGEKIEKKNLERVGTDIGKLTSKLNDVSSKSVVSMNKAAAACYEEYTREAELIKEDLGENPDMSQFVEKCADARKKMLEKITSESVKAESVSAGVLAAEKKKIEAELSEQRRKMTEELNGISEGLEERDAKKESIAADAILQAENRLKETELFSDTAIARQLTAELRRYLEIARQRYDNGEYEAAVVDAWNVISQSVNAVNDILSEERKVSLLYTQCTAAAEEIRQSLEKFRSINYTIKETASGEDKTVEVDNFCCFYVGEWEKTERAFSECDTALARGDYSCFSSEELIDIHEKLVKLADGFREETVRAYDRLHNNLLRNEYADIIAGAYIDMGFEEVEPDEDMAPLDGTVMMFRDNLSGDAVKVTLTPEYNSDGHLGVAVNIQSHDDEINDESTESKRAEQRSRVCNELMNSCISRSKGLTATHSCRKGTQNKNGF